MLQRASRPRPNLTTRPCGTMRQLPWERERGMLLNKLPPPPHRSRRTPQLTSDTHFSVCIVPRGGGPSAGARPPPCSPSSPSPLSIEPTCSRPAWQDSHALHTTHRCHPCCSHLRFDDPVSSPAPATITTLCSVHLHHAQPCKPRKSPWSTPSDSSLHRQQRAFGSLLPSSTHLLLRHPLRTRHQKTRLGLGGGW